MQHDISTRPGTASGVWRRPRWLWAGVGGGAIAVVLAAAGFARHVPAFYREALVAADPVQAEALSRRMLSKASALHAAFGRAGAWDAVIADDEVNAWLAVDLPRNHGRLLPEAVSAPRVAFAPHRVQAGARVGAGPVSGVLWVEVEVRLRGVNQVGLTLVDARVGSLPLPRGPLLREAARRLQALGLVTDLRRNETGPLLVVSLPATYDAAGTGKKLESLAVTDGELLLAGGAGAAGSGAERK